MHHTGLGQRDDPLLPELIMTSTESPDVAGWWVQDDMTLACTSPWDETLPRILGEGSINCWPRWTTYIGFWAKRWSSVTRTSDFNKIATRLGDEKMTPQWIIWKHYYFTQTISQEPQDSIAWWPSWTIWVFWHPKLAWHSKTLPSRRNIVKIALLGPQKSVKRHPCMQSLSKMHSHGQHFSPSMRLSPLMHSTAPELMHEFRR